MAYWFILKVALFQEFCLKYSVIRIPLLNDHATDKSGHIDREQWNVTDRLSH